MTVRDSYLNYSTGALKRNSRERIRWQDRVDDASGQYTGSYIDPAVLTFGRFQDTVDYSNGWLQARRLEKANHLHGMSKYTSRWDYGSPFYTRTVATHPAPKVQVQRVTALGVADSWNGYIFPHPDARNLCIPSSYGYIPQGTGDTGVPSVADLFAQGSRGIAETLPSVPDVSIAQSLGELREGMPAMIGKNIGHGLSNIGDEYLNWMFGIRPLIADLQAYASKAVSYSDYVYWWRRNEGRLVRRGVTLANTKDMSITKLSDAPPTPSPGGAHHWFSGTRELRTFTENEIWFSASYRQAAPLLDRERWESLKRFTNAYGVVPNALVFWNLSPWSWLLDWVINFDDLLTNISYLGKRGVSLHYAYVMCQTTVTRRWTYSGVYRPKYDSRIPGGGATAPLNLQWDSVTVTKQRQKASPFGFGVTLSGISPTQAAILTAIGVSRFL